MRLGGRADYYVVVVGFAAVVFLVLLAMMRSRWGVILRSMRENPDLATSLGVNIPLHRIMAYAVSGAVAGLAGQLYLYYRQNGLWPREVGGHDPVKEPGFFASYCPVQNVGTDYPPTLLLHGDQDTDVPYAQSVQMAEALARHGVPHELVTMAGYGHGFDGKMDDPTVQKAFLRVLDFLHSHI